MPLRYGPLEIDSFEHSVHLKPGSSLSLEKNVKKLDLKFTAWSNLYNTWQEGGFVGQYFVNLYVAMEIVT